MKKKLSKREKPLTSIKFCTECGEELEDFSLANGSTSEAAIKQHHNCKKTGKFNGDICSRVFITKEVDDSMCDSKDIEDEYS